jgi:hypothetical protein
MISLYIAFVTLVPRSSVLFKGSLFFSSRRTLVPTQSPFLVIISDLVILVSNTGLRSSAYRIGRRYD